MLTHLVAAGFTGVPTSGELSDANGDPHRTGKVHAVSPHPGPLPEGEGESSAAVVAAGRVPTFVSLTVLLILVFLAFGIQESDATQFVPLSIEQITAASKLILHGTVTSKTTLRDDVGRIYTKVEIEIADVWKGSISNNRFTIALIGGVLGDERVTAIGQAEYSVGEEVVAFVVLNARGEGVTVGLAHGKFEVYAEEGTGRKMARSRFHGGQAAPKLTTAQTSGRTTLTIETLKRRVLDTK